MKKRWCFIFQSPLKSRESNALCEEKNHCAGYKADWMVTAVLHCFSSPNVWPEIYLLWVLFSLVWSFDMSAGE